MLPRGGFHQSDAFQADLFPPAPSDQPALSSTEWLNGKTAPPILIDMETRQISTSTSEQFKPYKAATTAAPAPAQKAPERKEPSPTPAAAPSETKKVESPSSALPPPVEREQKQKEEKEEARSVPTSEAAAPPPAVSAPSPPPTNGASSTAQRQQDAAAGGYDEGELNDLREENEHLRSELAEKDAHIRELELKLERVRTAMA